MTSITHLPESQLPLGAPRTPRIDPFGPIRRWIDSWQVSDRRVAHLICKVIPCCCPFERDISAFGHTVHIPPLCKLNPLYNELVGLRYRALGYLADDCGEDITLYIC